MRLDVVIVFDFLWGSLLGQTTSGLSIKKRKPCLVCVF